MDNITDKEKYDNLLESLLEYQRKLHRENRKRIKVGMQCLFWVPLLFMFLMFLTSGEKVIFLILWIVSLFIIACYLICVEYIDFQVQERMREYGDNDSDENDNLIGSDIEALEESIDELLDQIGQKRTENIQRIMEKIEQQKENLHQSDVKQKGDGNE